MKKQRKTILGISGSLRTGSYNTKLLIFTLERIINKFDGTEYFIANLDLPLFNEDLEISSGIPVEVIKLARAIENADSVIISTPEYNKNLSGVLKNALDWISRVKPQPWKAKPVIILSTASGQSGGERAQNSLRLCLSPFDPILFFAPEVAIPDASNAFKDCGTPKSQVFIAKIDRQISNLEPYILSR